MKVIPCGLLSALFKVIFSTVNSEVTNQNLKHSDRNGSVHAFQTPVGHSQEGTARCTLGTPSSDFQHVLRICSDHS